MIIKQILYNISDKKDIEKDIRYIEIDWFETDKRIIRKKLSSGEDIAIKLDNHQHLHDGDVLFEDDKAIYVLSVAPVDAISYTSDDVFSLVQFAYLVGNRHAAVFIDGEKLSLLYDEPMFKMLKGYGFDIKKEKVKLLHLLEGHTHHEH